MTDAGCYDSLQGVMTHCRVMRLTVVCYDSLRSDMTHCRVI